MNHKNFIHPDFKIGAKYFTGAEKLLSFLEGVAPDAKNFLERWFDDEAKIPLKTSGTTGASKIIYALKKRMVASAKTTGKYFNLPEKSNILICLSADYIAGKMMWVRALTLGWHINIAENFATPLKKNTEAIDFCAMTPMQFAKSYDHIYKVKKCLIGGGAILQSTLEKIKQHPPQNELFQSYGMTETLSHIALRKINDTFLSTYHALDGINFTKDERGCLVIDAPNILETPLATNDLVRLKNNRTFEWLGRADNLINSGGVKIIPEKLEALLKKNIKENFFITGIPDELLGQKTILIVEERKKNLHTKNEIVNFLKGVNFEKHHRPKNIYFTSAFLKTDTGKIKRKATLQKILKQIKTTPS